MLKYATVIRDALHNLAPHSGASDEYRRGLCVGTVAALMGALNYEFTDALECARTLAPSVELFNQYAPGPWQSMAPNPRRPTCPKCGKGLTLGDCLNCLYVAAGGCKTERPGGGK